MAITNPPSLKIPRKILDDPELSGFFTDLTRDIYLIWEALRRIASEKTWAFSSPTSGTADKYYGGFYQFHSSAFTPAGGTNVGTANASYAAHAMVILGASSADMVVEITGTQINDRGTRTAAVTVEVDTSGGSTDDYFETSEKFIGQISYALKAGTTGVVINAGFCKYWDNNNTDFRIAGFEATWLGGANDSGADIQLLHHKKTGWTYAAGGTAIHPTAIAAMATDHVTEVNIVSGENGAWKRADLAQEIDGSLSEGTIIKVVTGSNKAFQLGNLMLRITPQ